MAMANSSTLGPHPSSLAPNPCIDRFGPGPEPWLCGSCANLRAGHQRMRLSTTGPLETVTVYTCAIDGEPRRVTSPSCAYFAEAGEFKVQSSKGPVNLEPSTLNLEPSNKRS